jgi:hypothetical protein
MELIINFIGWVATVLIVGAYALNSYGKLKSDSVGYQVANLFGGLLFIINTVHLKAYPSAVVNIVWVIVAFIALLKRSKSS